MSAIEWTERTLNVTTGCDRVSPGCDNCYALTMAGRLKRMGQAKYQNDGDPRTSGPGFGLTLHPATLDEPLRRKKPTTYFVNSMSDLFHRDVPVEYVARVFAMMSVTSQHTYQILTKRPQLMERILGDRQFPVMVDEHRGAEAGDFTWPPSNVWLGTSIESDRYTWRADHLRGVKAAVRFLSCEPLLGPLPSLNLDGIDWVIVGGESGPGARPMHPAWVRDIRYRCRSAGVAFFFKQWGAWGPIAPLDADGRYDMSRGHTLADDGTLYEPGDLVYPDGPRRRDAVRARHDRARLTAMYRLGKKASGRDLDGRTWDQMPEVTR